MKNRGSLHEGKALIISMEARVSGSQRGRLSILPGEKKGGVSEMSFAVIVPAGQIASTDIPIFISACENTA